MPRYIDADAIHYVEIGKGVEIALASDIDKIPTVSPDDVRGVVRGEWEEIEVMPDAYDICGVKTWASKMQCCNCGFATFAIEGHFGQHNFCPNCGAKMEVSEDA